MFILAKIVLYSWPLVTWFLFRRLRVPEALAATIVLGYLFIPERVGLKLPMLPILDKGLMPVLCAGGAMLILRHRDRKAQRRAAMRDPAAARPRTRGPATRSRVALIVPVLLAVMMVSIVMTWATNQSALFYADRVFPGLTPYDIGVMGMAVLVWLLPLLLAREYLRSREALIGVLMVFAYAGLAYSFLVLWEARMSPQLNRTLYGFFAHDWIQHIRGGYFRPIVFLEHGLRVGIFLAMAALAAAVLARVNADGHRMRWLVLSLWLLLCLFLSRNLGALMITGGLLPIILFLPVRLQFLCGACLGGLILLFPLARSSDLVPVDRIVSTIDSFNNERAGSLAFRFENEDVLLAKAAQQPLFGWGLWGRSRVVNEDTGRSESVTDGAWVIILGVYGRVGYLVLFGLLALPAVVAALRSGKFGLGGVEAGLVLVLCGNLIDLIPNSSMVPVSWLVAGALWGRLEQGATDRVEERRLRFGQKPAGRAAASRPDKRRRPGPKSLPPQGAKATPS